MIEESQEYNKSKKSTKLKKKSQQKIVEEDPEKPKKILEEGKQISEMSEPDQKEQRKKVAENFYELLEDLIACLLLDHDEFREEIERLLDALKVFDLSKITHKQIQTYSFWAKIVFIERKLTESPINFNSNIVEKQKEKLKQIFKQGLRSFQNLRQFYKDFKPTS